MSRSKRQLRSLRLLATPDTTMLDMIGEGISMEKIIKGKREADDLILTAVSVKSGIDINLLKRIVENLEGLDSDEPATT